VFAKPADARHDWEIFRDLSLRLTDRLQRKASIKGRLVRRARVSTSPTAQLAVLLRLRRKVSLRHLRAHPEGVDLGPLRPMLPEQLRTADHRVDLAPDLLVGDLDRLRRWLDDQSDDRSDSQSEGVLVLIGRRHKQDNNSWFHNATRLTRGKPRHQLLMHPNDLASRSIDDGSLVEVASRVGSVRVEVAATADIMPGVVSLPHGYGHQRDGVRLGVAEGVPGVSINDLTDPELLDVSGNAALNGVPVTVEAVAPGSPRRGGPGRPNRR
jgi:anaerobic selenocysteine-containing dehydrogenase